jgi:putative DNA primase/helicase
MDSDDTLEKILERIKIEAETEVWIGKPPKKFGDFSDWAFASRDLLKIETFIEHFKNEAHHEVFKKEIDKEKVSTSKTNTFHDRAFAREFNEKYEIKLYNSLFFQFNNGHYEEISKREIQHWIGEELEEIDPILAKASRMRDVFFQLEGFLDEIEEQDKTKINLKNGLYDLENEELIPHSKKFFHVNQIPYEYNPKAKPKMLLEWLNYAFDKENCKEEIIQSIQRFFGYCLLPACNEQKALWLVGIAESGKSKLAQLLCSLLGEVNTATLEILALKDKFGLAEIVNKKLIWMDEIDSSALSAIAESRLKSAISNNPIGVEKKGVDRVSLVPNAKWIFSTNKLPRFNDKSDGIYRRFIFLPFRNAIKRENVNPNFLQELLEKEASGILNWAIEGAKSYLEKGLIEPTASKQLKESHKSDSNPLADFVEEYLEIGNNGEISSTKLKELYSEYAEENGYRDQNVRSILKSIKEMFWHIKFDKRKSNGTTYYWNISIRIDKV